MKTFLRRAAILALLLLLPLLLLELRLRTVASPAVPTESSVSGDAIRILAIGDSITHGGLTEASYPFALRKLLAKEFGEGRVQVWNLGITGAETNDLYQHIDGWIQQYHPHVVITMVGAGDRNTVVPGMNFLFHNIRLARLVDVAWKSWRSELSRRWQGASADPLADVANSYLASGRDDLEYIRNLHDPLVATERPKSAERIHRMMLQKYPRHEHARLALGLALAKEGHAEEAEKLYRSVIADVEKRGVGEWTVPWAYFCLAALLSELQRDKELESLLRSLIKSHGTNELIYEHLAVLYRRQSRGAELQRVLETGIARAKSPDRLRMMLARYFRESGHEAEATAQEKSVRELLEQNLKGEQTAPIYRALSSRIVASGALHLAMQYPVLDLALLREVLGGESVNLRFVDNGNFRGALSKHQYAYYFQDDFGGLYGHLTKPGAELMGANVAAVLLPALKERGLAPKRAER